MIHLDTSLLIDALTGPRRSASALRAMIERGERIQISTIVLYEWRRGPRRKAELEAQDALFPSDTAAPFGTGEALAAAELYRAVTGARGREIDLAIAACAIAQHARLWTLSRRDFRDVPRLRLVE